MLSVTPPGVATTAAQTAYVLDQTASRVTFRGRAFIRTITGTSDVLAGSLLIRDGNLKSLRGDVRFPVTSLETDPTMHPSDLAELFGAERTPEVVFQVDSVARRGIGDESLVHGRLTMNGITRAVSFEGRTSNGGSRVITEGSTRVNVRQWHIEPPRRYGVRMAPDITLAFRAEFRRRRPQHTALFRPGTDEDR